VGPEAIPNEHHSPPPKVPAEVSQKRDEGCIGIAPRARLKEEAGAAAVPAKRCGSGSWGGRCLSMAPYVTGTGPTDGASAPPEGANVGYPPPSTSPTSGAVPPATRAVASSSPGRAGKARRPRV
jgi:hypothetical protein